MHLRSFEYFRAVAIILIVAGHCYDICGWQIDSFTERIIANVVSGGTCLFVFISGFLFHHVFYPRYGYRSFMSGKIRNVLMPYLFLSIFAIAQALVLHNPFPETYFGPGDTLTDQILRPALLYLLTGGVFAYWYIPFIMCIFALSPVFVAFIRWSRLRQVAVTLFFFGVSLLMHRPVDNFLVPQSVLFFTPVYLFGILCSLEKDYIYGKLQDKLGLLLTATLFFAVVQALTISACGNLQKPPFVFNGIDLNLIHKVLLCLFLMVFLHRFENRDSALVKSLASSSFAIYFLHGWFIYGFSVIRDSYTLLHGPYLVPLMTSAVILLSYLAALAIKTAIPRNSRWFIGW